MQKEPEQSIERYNTELLETVSRKSDALMKHQKGNSSEEISYADKGKEQLNNEYILWQ